MPALFLNVQCEAFKKGTDFTFNFSVKRTPAYTPLFQSIPVLILFQVIELFCLFSV